MSGRYPWHKEREYILADISTTKKIYDAIQKDMFTIAGVRPEIKQVIFNAPATIIVWSDGVKTVVKCQPGDTYNPETGFALAYLKRLLGNDNTFNKEINKWVGDVKYANEKDTNIYLAYKALYPVVYANQNKITKKQLLEATDKAIEYLERTIGGPKDE
jgi:hypothetical protein